MAETMMDISADDLLYEAWIVIVNAGWDGADKSEDWQEAAVRWRDKWHAYLWPECATARGVLFGEEEE